MPSLSGVWGSLWGRLQGERSHGGSPEADREGILNSRNQGGTGWASLCFWGEFSKPPNAPFLSFLIPPLSSFLSFGYVYCVSTVYTIEKLFSETNILGKTGSR